MPPTFLQTGQVEAHISRLTNIRTQLSSYKDTDGRAAEAIPAIEAAIESLRQEPFATDTKVETV